MVVTHVRRPAFRLIDAIALIVGGVILVGVLLTATIRVRQEDYRYQCVVHLKQLGLAVHNYAGAYQGALPALTSDLAKPKYGAYNGGIFVTLLPFLEQEVLFINGASKLPSCTWAAPIPPSSVLPFSVTPTASSPRPLYNVPMKYFLCIADATVNNQNSGNQNATNLTKPPYYFPWAGSSFAANYQVFGTVNDFSDRAAFGNSAVPKYSIGTTPDGNANTVFFGEVFSACGDTAGSLWAYPGIANYSGTQYGSPSFPKPDTDKKSPTYGGYNPAGANGLGDTPTRTASYLWAPVFGNSHQTYGFPQPAPGSADAASPAPLTYWDLPPQFDVTPGQCDKARLQSFHPKVNIVGMGDGSARFLGPISQVTWHAVLVPDDGVPLGSDWYGNDRPR